MNSLDLTSSPASDVTPLDQRPTGARRVFVTEAQRMRIVSAAVRAVWERGAESVTVTCIVDRAGVSKTSFYALFANRRDCLRAAFDEAVMLAGERVAPAYAAGSDWAGRMRAGLLALLEFLDAEPELAWLCAVQAAAAGHATLVRREAVLAEVARIVDEGREEIGLGRELPELVAEGVVGGVLGVIRARLLGPDPAPLIELSNALTAIVVLPYLGEAAALEEAARAAPTGLAPPRAASRESTRESSPLERFGIRLTYRTLRVLKTVGDEPGLSNRAISQRAGITDQGQISKLLTRLARHGLTENSGAGQRTGEANAWGLTRDGRELLRAVWGLR